MTTLFFEELYDFISEFELSSTSALLINGEGRHFSSGADVKNLLLQCESISEKENFFIKNADTFNKIYNLKIPVIAIISGICYGSALELALSCHFRFCKKTSFFSFPETGFNLMPGCGGTQRLMELVKKSEAEEILLSEKTFNSEDALSFNLIDKVILNDNIFEFSVNFARNIQNGYQRNLKNYYLEKSDNK